jgi:mannose-6-phosphate isomerase-like protein (cupin superfamily)
MLIKDIKTCNYSKVQDKTFLCELLHPERELNELKLDFSIAHAILKPGESSTPHYLCESTEVYFIIEGKGLMHLDLEKKEVSVGQAIYIPPGAKQWIENIGNEELKFLCIVSPPWRDSDDKLCP